MPPNQQYPGAPQPQQPPQPQYGPAPQPVQAPNGHYEVLPPLPVGQNTGHSGHNPYEFIVNPQAAHKKNPLLGGNKFVAQIAVIVGGALLLIIVAYVALSALGPKSPTADLTAIAQRQQEIVRISTAAKTQATSQDTKNFMVTVNASIMSDKQKTIAYLLAHHTKLKSKVLAMDQNAQTDALLANAATTSTYDSASLQVIASQIGTYQTLIQSTFKHTTSATLKKQLQQEFNAAGLLLAQAKDIGTK